MDPSGNSAEYPTHAAKALNWLIGTIGNTANAIQNGDKLASSCSKVPESSWVNSKR